MFNNFENNKNYYKGYADKIYDKRYNSPNPLRRYVHRAQYCSIMDHIENRERVLDVGCGEGVLSCLLAKQGVVVTGIDISEPNITAAKQLARKMGVENRVNFLIGDVENVPLTDGSFDVVISCHVLEHLPDFNRGLTELFRLSRDKVIVALPSLLNLCSIVQVGYGGFWEKNPRSFLALPFGLLRTLFHLWDEGVDEGYSGHKELSHLWRFPWIIRRKLSQDDYKIMRFEASSICLPYFFSLLPLIKLLDKARSWPVFRNLGYGTTVVLKKMHSANL